MTEMQYQRYLKTKLLDLFPGCLILENDAKKVQGIPDLVVFYDDRYAFLEVKLSEDSPQQPNQEYYVHMLDEMSFGMFIYPENEKQVLHELEFAFYAPR